MTGPYQNSYLNRPQMSPLMMAMMAAQIQKQQQEQQPQGDSPLSGLGDIISGFGGGGAAGTAGKTIGETYTLPQAPNLGASMAPETAGLQMGIDAGAPSAGFGNLGLGGMGAGSAALGALGAGVYANNIYEGGGKDIIRGKGKSEDYVNLLLDINPVTAPINMIGRALGMKSVGRALFGKKTGTGARKNFVGGLTDKGFLDSGKLSFGDGSSFDLGKEKKYLQNLDGSKRQGFDLDEKDSFMTSQIPKFDAIAKQLVGDKHSDGGNPGYEHMTRYLINAATQGTRDQKVVDQRLKELQSKLSGSSPGSGLSNAFKNAPNSQPMYKR
jgi:hypothetical protein